MPQRDESAESTWGTVAGVALLGVALVLGAAAWPSLTYTTGLAAHLPFKGSDKNALNRQLLAEGRGGLKSVSWAEPSMKG